MHRNIHPVAVFWDQSHVWGLICLDTLTRYCAPFHLVSAAEIASGCLDRYRVLVVPGGWASHKVQALGVEGKNRIEDFIRSGGSYLGLCGGAGLAMASPPSLGMVSLKRMPFAERLANASGRVLVRGNPDHPAWKDLSPNLPVSVWWPSQFAEGGCPGVLSLATYAEPGEDFCVADLPLEDLLQHDVDWCEWEKSYGINLNPGKLMGHTAINEVPLGRGRLILSYPHLETPGDSWGNRLFLNILAYLDGESSHARACREHPEVPRSRFDSRPGRGTLRHVAGMRDAADALIAFGERQMLWQWRHPWLLRWRRGIRGLEYGTLAVMARALFQAVHTAEDSGGAADPWQESAADLARKTGEFCELSRRLLLEEKLATQNGKIQKLGSVNLAVDGLRKELFGSGMSAEGSFKTVLDGMCDFLLQILRLSPGRGGRVYPRE
ncbi:MAG: BPL-N domain-containing protein [Syntrophobacteraceae bacterium]|nr:BPL-N domain-containing protein [Desulfobacteraceae bacterium]